MTYSDIRKWLLASQGGCKLFQTCVMWLISSDNWADGTCTMLVITLGSIFGAKTQNVRKKNAFTRNEAFTVLYFSSQTQKQKCWFFNPPEVSFSALRRRRWRLASEVGSSSSRASEIEKTKQVAAYWPAHIRGQPQHGADTSWSSGPLLAQILRLQLREGSDMLQMSGFNLPPRLCLRELHFQGKCAVSCPMRVEGCGGDHSGDGAGRHCCHTAFSSERTPFCKGSDLCN